ncbi:MAG TPA: hypothetical protein VGQ27_02455 [Steroidobacteraceae bacterium]|nr:hypothetical protein [Steroidobacteraceae bacterium]
MPSYRSPNIKVVLVVAVIGAIFAWQRTAWQRTRQTAESTTVPRPHPVTAATPAAHGAEFDFYLLALTVHAAFCADGHGQKGECRARSSWPLVLHGLWPENRESRTSPRDCPAPPLDLQAGLAAELEPYMPGMVDGLQEHEWREHGGCTGLDDDEYFSRALELTRGVESALGARLTTLAGNETDPQTLRAAAELYQPGIGATFILHCRSLRDAPRGARDRPYLVEIRQCVRREAGGAPGAPFACDSVGRRDQGCGASFYIAP